HASSLFAHLAAQVKIPTHSVSCTHAAKASQHDPFVQARHALSSAACAHASLEGVVGGAGGAGGAPASLSPVRMDPPFAPASPFAGGAPPPPLLHAVIVTRSARPVIRVVVFIVFIAPFKPSPAGPRAPARPGSG